MMLDTFSTGPVMTNKDCLILPELFDEAQMLYSAIEDSAALIRERCVDPGNVCFGPNSRRWSEHATRRVGVGELFF